MLAEPHPLFTAAQVRELDRAAIEGQGIAGIELMTRAGRAVFDAVRNRWPQAREWLILCGSGNNGGDGYIIAALALEAGLAARVLTPGAAASVTADARAARERFLAAGGCETEFAGELPSCDLIIDALFGTGLARPVEGEARDMLAQANAAQAARVAVDIPSGLQADSGRVLGAAFRADLTVTFIGRKQGLYTGEAVDCCGEILFDDLGVPDVVYAATEPAARLLSRGWARAQLPRRRRAAHKGHHGHVLVIGGDYGYAGAPRLAAEAALRAGAGLVSLATRPEHAAAHAAVRPEIMCRAVADRRALRPLLERADIIAAGPGLGQEGWGRELLAEVLATDKPLVLDADALNLLAQNPRMIPRALLTPHPGEAARLLGSTVAAVEADRYAAVRELQLRYGGVVVLKGAGTLIAAGADAPAVCAAGNPGMASGGMGDLLTGVIAALMAQGLVAPRAAEAGVCLHAAAGDAAAREGERGMLASDLLPWLRREVNEA